MTYDIYLSSHKTTYNNPKMIQQLIQNVLGYSFDEAQQLMERECISSASPKYKGQWFIYNEKIATNLTKKQVLKVFPVLYNNNLTVWVQEYNSSKGIYPAKEFPEYPKEKVLTYDYDEPAITADQRTDPFWVDHTPIIPNATPPQALAKPATVTCPYCGSSDTKKITAVGRMASFSVFGIFSGKLGKQWHCNKCKSDF